MSNSFRPTSEEVEHLLLNASLREELEPFSDESVALLDMRRLPTPVENEFLASMLAWERAPILPLSKWFEPELILPRPETLTDAELHDELWKTIHRMYRQRIVLEYTDHLTDRQLYRLIYRDILPAAEKKVDLPKNYLHWHCIDDSTEPEVWLRYYASQAERQEWADENDSPLPPSESPPFPRKMPRRAQ